MNWKYTDETRTVVYRINEDGTCESCIATREDVVEWVMSGGVIEEPTAPAGAEG